MVDVRFAFVDVGSTVRVEGEPGEGAILAPGQVYLDVGSRCDLRVLDHHREGCPYRSATELATRRYDELITKALHGWTGPVTLTTHVGPDLDGCCAIYYVKARLEGRVLPTDAWDRIVEMVSDNDQGYVVHPVETSFPVLFRAACEAAGPVHDKDPERFLREVALPLIDALVDSESRGESSAALFARVRRDPLWRIIRPVLDRAVQDYEDDVRRARVFQLFVPRQALALPDAADHSGKSAEQEPPAPAPARSAAQWTQVDACILANPASVQFKEFVRSDKARSPRGKGFPLLLVHREEPGPMQHMISVDPATGVCLTGLGANLEAEEKRVREQHPDREQEPLRTRPPANPGRHGYGVDDPWYDGRGHAHTILATPRNGSALKASEVQEIVWQYGHPGHFVHALHADVWLFFAVHNPVAADGPDRIEGWTVVTAPEGIAGGFLPAMARHYGPGGQGAGNRAVVHTRELEASLLPEAESGSAPARATLTVFPDGVGIVAIRAKLDRRTPLLTLGTMVASLRARFDGFQGVEALVQKLNLPRQLRPAHEVQPYVLTRAVLDDAEVELGKVTQTAHGVLYSLARALPMSFENLAEQDTLERMERVSSQDGRQQAWLFANTGAVLETCAREKVAGTEDSGEARAQVLEHLLALVEYQKLYLVRVAERAEQGMEQIPSREGYRIISDLHEALVRFSTRWRVDDVTLGNWEQQVYERWVALMRISSLAQGALSQLQQVVDVVHEENERFQNRMLFFLSVVFFPVNMAAALLSGAQLSATNSMKSWFPWVQPVAEGEWGGWTVFGVYLLAFAGIGSAVYLVLRHTARYRRKTG